MADVEICGIIALKGQRPLTRGQAESWQIDRHRLSQTPFLSRWGGHTYWPCCQHALQTDELRSSKSPGESSRAECSISARRKCVIVIINILDPQAMRTALLRSRRSRHSPAPMQKSEASRYRRLAHSSGSYGDGSCCSCDLASSASHAAAYPFPTLESASYLCFISAATRTLSHSTFQSTQS
jgi:hypothetical protein